MADNNIVMDMIDEAIENHMHLVKSSVHNCYADDDVIMGLLIIIELQQIEIEALKRLAEEES